MMIGLLKVLGVQFARYLIERRSGLPKTDNFPKPEGKVQAKTEAYGMKPSAFRSRRPLAVVLVAAMMLAVVRSAVADVPSRTVAPSETFTSGILRVERFGRSDGDPIVFIPALFCGSWQWNGQVHMLANRYDLYVVTLPGFDGRPPIAPTNLMQRALTSLSQLIVQRHLAKPIIVGHSLGGTLAVLFGETHSPEIRAVIAVEGGYPDAPTAAARAAAVEKSSAPFADATSPAAFDKALRSMLQYIITSPKDVDTVARLAERSDPHAIADWMRAALLLDLTPGLRSMRVPFVEIVPYDAYIDGYRGFRSLEAKRRAYEAFVEHAAGNSGVVMIAPARHFVMFDQPAAFDHALTLQIQRVSDVNGSL
jgi:pimeloyl-ACP methyl ester carboxylesterase